MLTLQLAMFAQFATSPVLQEISTQITTTIQAPPAPTPNILRATRCARRTRRRCLAQPTNWPAMCENAYFNGFIKLATH